MNATKILTALMAVLVVSAGAGAVTAANIDAETTAIDASYDNGTVTVTVTENEAGVENVSVSANDEHVGTTDANGTLTFETNATDELELEFTKNNTTIEREYVIQNGTLVSEEDAEDESQLDATATYDNGTVAVTVTQNGTGVENVSVTANGEDVGMTDANGTLTFETNATEELELEFEKGEMELEQEYVIQDGALVLEEEAEDDEDVSLSANENASDRAHAVLAVVQQFLNSGGEGNLGQQIQDALGTDRGNAEDAKENGKQNGNADAAPGQSNEADDENEQNENADETHGQSNAGNGNGNAPDHASDDEDDEDDEESDE